MQISRFIKSTNMASLENARLRIPIAAYSKPIEKEAFARNRLDSFIIMCHWRGASEENLKWVEDGYWAGWRVRGIAPKGQT